MSDINGPVWQRCYDSPPQVCDICQQLKSISVRRPEGQSASCIDCYRVPKGTYATCGRVRHGFQRGDGGVLLRVLPTVCVAALRRLRQFRPGEGHLARRHALRHLLQPPQTRPGSPAA